MIEAGDICRAMPMIVGINAALVLVTEIGKRKQSATVTLLSPDIELGTSADLLLKTEASGLTYPLLVQSEVFGYMSISQLSPCLGKVALSVITSLAALQDDSVVNHELAGPPLTERSDVRWRFKLTELARLQALTNYHTGQLINGWS